MASIILGTVGAGLGSAFGGPAGARLGFSIGATLGGFLDTPKAQNTESGKLDDLKVTASAYGTAIPLIWGGMATGGNIIWATDLKEHKHKQKQGGKGGGGATSTTYSYSVSLAVLVCAGRPGLTVSRIQANDLVIWEAGNSGNVITPRRYDGSQTAADPLIQSIEGVAPCYAGLNYFVLEDLDLSKFGNSIPQLKIETAQAGVTVGSVLSDVSLLAGLSAPNFDYTAAIKPVAGFIINNRTAARDSLKPLLSWALTDLVETGGALTAMPRGGAPVLTINLDDLGAFIGGTADLLTERRTQDVELPWRVDCKYFSAETGKHYEQGSQGAIRIGAPQQQALSLDLPLSLLDADARACAEQQLQQAWVERSPVILLLPPRYLTTSPADILTLPAGAVGTAYEGACTTARRLKVESVGLDLPGVITLTCVDDDAALPSQAQPPGSALPPSAGTTLGVVNTDFAVWSGTELRDSDLGTPGFYLAATGAAGWTGAQIYYSENGTDWISGGVVSGKSIFGTTTSALSNAPGASGDSVGVAVNGVLESASAGEVQAGINSARLGAEILGFADASLTATGRYTLGTLTRARRGSVGTGHTSAEPFVLLDPSALARVTVPAALIGTVVQVKCVSDYQALADVAAQSVTIALPSPTAAQVAEQGLQAQIDVIHGTYFAPSPPVKPTSVEVLYIQYLPGSAAMGVTFAAAQYSADIATSLQTYQWQSSIDSGASWQGYDGTSATTVQGPSIFPIGITSGTVRARVRSENAVGVLSGWTERTVDTAYTAPPPTSASGPNTSEVTNARTEPAAAPLTAGQTYSSLKARLDGLLTRLAVLYSRTITAGMGLTGGGDLTANRTLSLLAATASALGGIKPGSGLSVVADGTLSVTTLAGPRILVVQFKRSGALSTGYVGPVFTNPYNLFLTLTGVRVASATQATGLAKMTLNISAGSGAVNYSNGFAVGVGGTSQEFYLPNGTKCYNTNTISPAFILTQNDQLDLNITDAGSGVAELSFEAIFSY